MAEITKMDRGWLRSREPHPEGPFLMRRFSIRQLLLQLAPFSVPGMDPEKLERIQLPVPTAAEKTTYNHLLTERLIRIMNNAAQPGAWGCWLFTGAVAFRGTRHPRWRQEPWFSEARQISATPPATHTHVCATHACLPTAAGSSCLGLPPFPTHGVWARPCLSFPSTPNPSASFVNVCGPPLGWPEATFEHE